MKKISALSAMLIILTEANAQLYIPENGLSSTGSGTNKTVAIGGTLSDAATSIDFGSSFSNSNFLFKKGSTNYFYIANDGKIGMGTANPTNGQLHLYQNSTDGFGIKIENAGATGSYPYIALTQMGSNGWGVSGWANAAVLEGTGTGGLTMCTYSGDLKFQTTRVTRMTIDPSGNIGIGTSSPTYKLHVNGGLKVDGNSTSQVQFTGNNPYNPGLVFNGSTSNLHVYTFDSQNFSVSTDGNTRISGSSSLLFNNTANLVSYQQPLTIKRSWPGTAAGVGVIFDNDVLSAVPSTYRIASFRLTGTEKAWIDQTGGAFFNSSVGIGTSTPNANAKLDVNGNIFSSGKIAIGTTDMTRIGSYSLAVNGDAIFNKVKVKLYGNWPDYVFEKDYNLVPLSEVENYIRTYHHLPGVLSAREIEKDGLDLGDNQAALLKKIEELTLYIIDQHKKIEGQQQQISALKEGNNLIKNLQEELKEIKEQLAGRK